MGIRGYRIGNSVTFYLRLVFLARSSYTGLLAVNDVAHAVGITCHVGTRESGVQN
jgi:hypothetical protein